MSAEKLFDFEVTLNNSQGVVKTVKIFKPELLAFYQAIADILGFTDLPDMTRLNEEGELEPSQIDWGQKLHAVCQYLYSTDEEGEFLIHLIAQSLHSDEFKTMELSEFYNKYVPSVRETIFQNIIKHIEAKDSSSTIAEVSKSFQERLVSHHRQISENARSSQYFKELNSSLNKFLEDLRAKFQDLKSDDLTEVAERLEELILHWSFEKLSTFTHSVILGSNSDKKGNEDILNEIKCLLGLLADALEGSPFIKVIPEIEQLINEITDKSQDDKFIYQEGFSVREYKDRKIEEFSKERNQKSKAIHKKLETILTALDDKQLETIIIKNKSKAEAKKVKVEAFSSRLDTTLKGGRLLSPKETKSIVVQWQEIFAKGPSPSESSASKTDRSFLVSLFDSLLKTLAFFTKSNPVPNASAEPKAPVVRFQAPTNQPTTSCHLQALLDSTVACPTPTRSSPSLTC